MLRTVDVFNDNGDYIGAKIDAPDEWGKFYEDTPSYEIIRKQLEISNRGLKVIDAVPVPLCCAMGKTDNEDHAVGITNFDLTLDNKWEDHYDYNEEERAWMDEWNIVDRPNEDNVMFPIGSLRHGTHTTFSDISPEVEMFDNTPLATPIKSAIKYATICKSANVDPSDFLRKVEDWWDMEPNTLDMINVPEISDISYPRVAGSSSKNSSPIYGMDNYAGRVDIEHTGLTRESFMRDDEEDVFAVADFGRFNAFMRYAVGLSDALPGLSRNSIRGKKGRCMWAISPEYAFKYKKEDFIVKIPNNKLPTVKAGKASKVIVDYLGSDEYIRHLISMYAKIDVDKDYNFSGIDIRNKLLQLKKQITNPLPKPLMLTFDDVQPINTIQPKYIPNIQIKKDICSIVIDNIGTNSLAIPEVAACVGSFINVCSEDKYDYTEDESKRVILVNCVTKMISNGSQVAIKSEVKRQYGNSVNMSHNYGFKPYTNRDCFENVVHTTLSSNYKGVVIKVYGFKEKFVTIYVDEMDTGKVNPHAVEVKGVADALRAWASFYSAKCWKLTEKDTESDMEKVVMYSSIARILIGASFNVKKRILTWPDIGMELIRKATNYAKKRKKKFTITKYNTTLSDLGDMIDSELEPQISFKNLALCLESTLAAFEDDLLSRKSDFSPTDVSSFPRRWYPPAANPEEETVTLDDDMLAMLMAMTEESNMMTQQFTNAQLNRDKYDILIERAYSLYLNVDDVFKYVSTLYGVKATNITELRATFADVKADDLDIAVKKGLLKQNLAEPTNLVDANLSDEDVE